MRIGMCTSPSHRLIVDPIAYSSLVWRSPATNNGPIEESLAWSTLFVFRIIVGGMSRRRRHRRRRRPVTNWGTCCW